MLLGGFEYIIKTQGKVYLIIIFLYTIYAMEKFIILMWLCSATTSTPLNCKQIKTDRVKFVDQYSCTVYGYTNSLRVIRDLGREKINQHNLFTKFLCAPERYIRKKELDA